MKKIHIIILMFFLHFTIALAQGGKDTLTVNTDSVQFNQLLLSTFSNSSTEKPEVIPSSPQSKVFERYLNHKITEYNGLPNIEIPLFDIEIKGLRIPVVLSYHAGGIKYKQFHGEVGLGWALNLGGYRVSRDIKGRADERFQKYDKNQFEYEIENNYEFGRGDAYLGSLGFRDLSSYTCSFVVNGKFNYQDGEYDMFNYMLPSTSGKFIISDRNEYYPGMITRVALLEEKNDRIQPITEKNKGINNIIKFDIKDDKGFSYILGGKKNNIVIAETPYGQVDPSYTAWPLLQIVSPYNEIIDFDYIYQRVSSNRNKSQQLNIIDGATGSTGSEGQTASAAQVYVQEKKYYDYIYNNQYMIDKIQSDNFSVRFERKPGLDCDFISAIKIYDKNNQLIKHIEFQYNDIFLKTIDLKGSGLEGDKYQFEYYGTYGNGIDQWGYYCQQQNRSFEDMSLHNEFKNDYFIYRSSRMAPGKFGFHNITDINEAQYLTNYLSLLRNCNWADRKVNSAPSSFSLKKIVYPTGGSSEYIYESHKYRQTSEIFTGGGQRIKLIISRASIDSDPIISEYKYGKDENGIGYPNLFFNHRNFSSEMYSFDNFQGDITKTTNRKYSTTPLVMGAEISSFNVYYDNVNIYKYSKDKYTGHTHLTYSIPKTFDQYSELNYMPFFQFHPNSYQIWVHPVNQHFYHYVKGYNWADKPLVETITVYDSQRKKINEENYSYFKNKQKIQSFDNVNVFQRLFGSLLTHNTFGHFERYVISNSFFDYYKYNIYTGKYDLISHKETISYDENRNSITQKEEYYYNDNNQLIKKKQINNSLGNTEETYTYPADYPYGTETEIIEENIIFTEMINQNIVSPVIETITIHNGEEVKRIKTNYFKTSDGICVPASVLTSSSGIDNLKTDIIFDLYDKKGNILQYTTKNGISTSYLWGYNYMYPIAEIQNSNYNDVKSKLSIDTDILAQSMNPNMNIVNSLRSSLPMANISTFTYKPMVGTVTATDPQNTTTYYEYDSANRLQGIRDSETNYLEYYKYNYTNEPIEIHDKLELSITRPQDFYEINQSQQFEAIVKGGSGNFKYNWHLYRITSEGGKEIQSIRNSADNFITFNFPENGEITVTCEVVDQETGYKKSLGYKFVVYSYLELKMTTNTKYKKYTMTDTETFTVTPTRGSGNYVYNWYLKDSQGSTILSQLNSSSNKFSIDFSKTKTGQLQIYCIVKDINSQKEEDVSKIFDVDWLDLALPVDHNYFIYDNNSSSVFSVSVRGGSRNFKYDWYIISKDNNLVASSINSNSNQFSTKFSSVGEMSVKCVVRDISSGKSAEIIGGFSVRKIITFTDVTESYNNYEDGTSVSTQKGFIYNPLNSEPIKLYLNFQWIIKNGARAEYTIGDQFYAIDATTSQENIKYIEYVLPPGHTPVQLTLIKRESMSSASLELIVDEENSFVGIGVRSLDVN